jgi:hypothetical protein
MVGLDGHPARVCTRASIVALGKWLFQERLNARVRRSAAVQCGLLCAETQLATSSSGRCVELHPTFPAVFFLIRLASGGLGSLPPAY